MLAAYYSCECDSKELFAPFEIAKSPDFETYLNQYDTIFLNMQEFLSQSQNMDDMLALIRKSVLWELLEKYLDFLRDLLKDKAYIHLAYMTGILPIKKCGTHSALNMFDEFFMLNPGPLASYVGFTENEVSALCQNYKMDLSEIKNWYDGYSFSDTLSIYSPRSVVNSMLLNKIGNYWNQTETFEALQVYIDMTTFRTEDDVLTLLIHLGYLSYDNINKCVFIPNEEVRSEYINAVSVSDWGEVSKALIMM